MKNINSQLLKKGTMIFLVLLLVAGFVRFYDYPNRLIFGPEQSMSLITTGEYIKEKFSLLGEPYIQRQTSDSHYLFHSALFNYGLMPLELLFHFDPFLITLSFGLLNLLTGVLLYFLVKKETGPVVAWLTTFLFLFNSKMIHHSLFVWSLNLLPLVGLLSFYCLWKMYKDVNKLHLPFVLGVLSGIGFGLQYVFAFSALAVLLLTLVFSKKKILSGGLFLVGAILGIFPMVLFDLKHNFFHLKTLYQYFLDVKSGTTTGFYTYYQFLNLWPLFSLIGGLALSFIYKFNKFALILILVSYLFFNLNSPFTRLYSQDIKDELKLENLEKVAETISKDQPPEKFNITMLMDFDTRAHPLRYLLTFKYGFKPQAVTNYNDIDTLYVLAPTEYDIMNPVVWELKTYLPYQAKLLDTPTQKHNLYKITK
jgi:hypothetical protein